MNDIASKLRAQIPWSTDPGWLEQMACEAEGRTSARHHGSASGEGRGKCPNCTGWVRLAAVRCGHCGFSYP